MRVDFHSHTHYSRDSIADIGRVLKAAHARGLGKLVITDHNTIRGALDAKEREPEFVIVGEEIKTSYGELLASFVKEEIPKGLDPFKVIEMLKAQDAFISVSHPMDPYRSDWPLSILEEIAPLVDGVEVANARVLRASMNEEAQEFASIHELFGTAGSDGHHPSEVGRMALEIEDFHDTASLKAVIGQATVTGSISPSWVHGFSVWAKFVKRLGWTGDSSASGIP